MDEREENNTETTSDKGISIPESYEQDLIDSSNYISAASSDLADAAGICMAVDSSGIIDVLKEELTEKGIFDDIETLNADTSDIYTEVTGIVLATSTLYNAFINAINNIKKKLDAGMEEIDYSQLSPETAQLIQEYLSGKIDFVDFLNEESSVLEELSKLGIEAFREISKESLKYYIKEFVSSEFYSTMATYGIVIAEDIINANFFKAGVSAAKKFLSDMVKKIADNSSTDAAATAIGGKASSLAQFLNSPFGKNTSIAVISLIANLTTKYFDDCNLSKEDVTESAIKAGLAVASNMLGEGAVAVLGLTAGTMPAVLVGALVAAGITWVGSYIIDSVKHNMNYFEGEVPKKFERITLEEVEDYLKDNKISFNENSENEALLNEYFGAGSPEDIGASLKEKGYPEEIVDIIIKTANNASFEDISCSEDGYITEEYLAIRTWIEYNRGDTEIHDDEFLYINQYWFEGSDYDKEKYLNMYHELQDIFIKAENGDTEAYNILYLLKNSVLYQSLGF